MWNTETCVHTIVKSVGKVRGLQPTVIKMWPKREWKVSTDLCGFKVVGQCTCFDIHVRVGDWWQLQLLPDKGDGKGGKHWYGHQRPQPFTQVRKCVLWFCSTQPLCRDTVGISSRHASTPPAVVVAVVFTLDHFVTTQRTMRQRTMGWTKSLQDHSSVCPFSEMFWFLTSKWRILETSGCYV